MTDALSVVDHSLLQLMPDSRLWWVLSSRSDDGDRKLERHRHCCTSGRDDTIYYLKSASSSFIPNFIFLISSPLRAIFVNLRFFSCSCAPVNTSSKSPDGDSHLHNSVLDSPVNLELVYVDVARLSDAMCSVEGLFLPGA
jgi:hypothetical protein